MNVRFVPREEIDKVKWNSCVHYAINGNIFGYIWYLDAMARQWDALVEGDYESVMPLCWQSHWWHGRVLRQPELIRQTDIYSIHVLSSGRVEAFWQALRERYKHINLCTDHASAPPPKFGKRQDALRNYQLSMLEPYELLAEKFSPSLMAQLSGIETAGFVPNNNLKPERVAAFYQQQDGRGSAARERFHGLQRIMYQALHRGWGFPTSIQNQAGELLAADFIGISHERLISLAPARLMHHPQSAQAQASLYYYLLKQHAGRPLLFDFNVRKEADAVRARDFGASAMSDLLWIQD